MKKTKRGRPCINKHPMGVYAVRLDKSTCKALKDGNSLAEARTYLTQLGDRLRALKGVKNG